MAKVEHTNTNSYNCNNLTGATSGSVVLMNIEVRMMRLSQKD